MGGRAPLFNNIKKGNSAYAGGREFIYDIQKYTRLGKILSNSRIYAVINDLVKSPMLNKVLEFISMLTGSKTTRILLLLLKILSHI